MKYTIDERKVVYADLDPKEGVVLNLVTKNYYRLNETSQVIWQGLAAANTPDQIAETLVRQFDVSLETALHDIQEFIASLRKERLLSLPEENLPSFSVEKAQVSKRKPSPST